MKEELKTYIFHWRDGTKSEGNGVSPEDAFTKLGYGRGAVKALDYYEIKKEESTYGRNTR